MKYIIYAVLILAFSINIAQAKTLVKYNKNDGSIIQTNPGLNKMPSDEILNDRFRSEYTDVILVEDAVNVSMQRVDLNTKQIKDISEAELNIKKKLGEAIAEEEALIKEEIRQTAIKSLQVKGIELKHNKVNDE